MISHVGITEVFKTSGSRPHLAISIVTPAYNPGPDMAITFASLQAQTFKDFEWIVVDDGSRDDVEPAIRQISAAAAFPVTLLRHHRNSGQAQARNSGLVYAAAAFVKFLDADDELDTPHLEKLLTASHAPKTPQTVYFAPTRHLFVASGKQVDNNSYTEVGGDREAQLVRMLTAPFMHHCGALFPRALLDQLGGYDASLVTDEDGDLLLRALLLGWHFEMVGDVHYIYRHHERAGRVSRDDTPEKIAARRRVAERVIAHFSARGDVMPPAVKAALCRRLDAMAVRNWRASPAEARDLLAFTQSIEADYQWSGSRAERMVRGVAGIGAARWLVTAVRSLRGVGLQ